MTGEESAEEGSSHESPEPAVKNRSKRIRKIKHSDDFEYNNLGVDDQQDDSASSPKKGKRGKPHIDDDGEFDAGNSPKKGRKTSFSTSEADDEHAASWKKKLAKMGIALPKKPKAGYVAFVTSIRDSVAAKYPQATFGDLTHLLAEEWNKLPQEEKRKHLDKAKLEKEKYFNELREIEKKYGIDVGALSKLRRRRGCKPFSEKVRNVLAKNKSTMFARKSLTSEEKYKKMLETSGVSEGEEGRDKPRRRKTTSDTGGEIKRRRRRRKKEEAQAETDGETVKEENEENEEGKEKKEKEEVKPPRKPRVKKVEIKRKFRLHDVPKVEAAVFTDDFLEINKGREAELRQLRKAVGDLEEQTVALRHHVTCLEDSRSYLEESINQAKKLNSDLSHYVVDLSNVVVKNFAKVKVPGCGDLTHGNIGKFTEELLSLLEKGGKEATAVLKVARAVAANLDLPA